MGKWKLFSNIWSKLNWMVQNRIFRIFKWKMNKTPHRFSNEIEEKMHTHKKNINSRQITQELIFRICLPIHFIFKFILVFNSRECPLSIENYILYMCLYAICNGSISIWKTEFENFKIRKCFVIRKKKRNLLFKRIERTGREYTLPI